MLKQKLRNAASGPAGARNFLCAKHNLVTALAVFTQETLFPPETADSVSGPLQSSTWKLLQQREYNEEGAALLRFDEENGYHANLAEIAARQRQRT
ncbi:MAG TPA: hypothetical protein VMB49_10645 [Acidobacteriaceae bacterium]|nr:hypothetical protein [Acidobacteriaceae bacterium]